MKKILFYIFLLSAVSCRYEHLELQLGDVGTYLSERPDSALAVLDSLHGEGIRGRKNKAHYALLYSMALDKNYVDETDDSLINIAVRWYRRHGSPDERLKAWYYLGRVQQNAGDNEAAMESFVRAEQWADKAEDFRAVAMLYSVKAVIYHELFSFEHALSNMQSAADYYLAAKDTSAYLDLVSNIALSCFLQNKDEDFRKNIGVLKEHWDRLDMAQKSGYYSLLLDQDGVFDIDDDAILSDYLKNVTDSTLVDWLRMARTYCRFNNYGKALESLETYRQLTPEYEDFAEYQLVNAAVHDSLGRYEDALRSYQKYIDISDGNNMAVFGSEAIYVEDRLSLEYEIMEHRYRLWITFLLLAVLLLSVILVSVKVRAVMRRRQAEQERLETEKLSLKEEKERYRSLYEQAVQETKQLQKLSRNSKLDKNVREVLNRRLEVLNVCIAGHLVRNMSDEVSDELEKLMSDREEFLNTTRMSFMVAHPHFITYLHKAGLTDWEIGCCCLFCIGLNGSDIKSYLGRNSFYNDSTVVRSKLGLKDSKCNLSTFLKEKMQELD